MEAATEKKSQSPFVLPRTLDEIMVTLALIAWPFIFMFLLLPDMELNAGGEVIAWIVAFGIQCGIFYGLQTARRRGR